MLRLLREAGLHLIYSDDRATINTVAAVLDGVTFPLGAIASIQTRELSPSGVFFRFFLGGFAAFMALFALAYLWPEIVHRQAGQPVYQGGVRAGLFYLTACFGAGAAAWLNPPQRRFALIISTAAGEKAALVSGDAAYIEALRRAVETALIGSAAGAARADFGTHPQ